MQELILGSVFVVDFFKSLLCMEKCVACEEVDGFCVVDFEFVFDDHN